MSEDLLSEFIFDARDHLATAGAQLLDLEKDPGGLDCLNALMGTLHTLKGNSGFMDLRNLYHLMHNAESLLQTIREKQVECRPPMIDLLLQVLDTAEAALNRLENGESDAVDWLDALNQALSDAENRLEHGLDEKPYQADADQTDDYSQVYGASAEPEAARQESIPGLEAVPGAAAQVTLADGDLDRLGANFPDRVEALFKAGGKSLVVDLKGLTSLTGRELKLILAASRKNPDRTAFLVDPDEQPDLHRLFQVLDPDQRLNIFPDQAPALAHFGGLP